MTISEHPRFRRVIQVATHVADGQGQAKVALEDDYHHFRVHLVFEQGRIAEARGEALRTPYTLCANATGELKSLAGMPLSANPEDLLAYTDQRLQCTHMFDEAGLAMTCAARGIAARRYDVEVPRHIAGATRPRLWRDGKEALCWNVENETIVGPEPFSGLPLGRGFSRWCATHLDADEAEAALVLRRCAMISRGRLRNLDLEVHARASGHCYVQQPQRSVQALRMIGSTEDFSDRGDLLCSADQGWLQDL